MNALPYEVRAKVFDHLDGITFANIQSLSREYNNLYKEIIYTIPNIWHTKCIKEINEDYINDVLAKKEKFIYTSSYYPLAIKESSCQEVGDLNLVWEKLYATWYLQKRIGGWKKVEAIKINKYSDDKIGGNFSNPDLDVITRAIFNGSYLVTGHESGYICQWNLDNPKTPLPLAHHVSGCIRDMILINKISAHKTLLSDQPVTQWLRYIRIASIAQDNMIKINPFYASQQTCVPNLAPISISHPRGPSGPPGVGLDKPFLTVLCPVAGRPEYFCTGARCGFVSIWEQDETCAYMRILFQAHDSEIIHLATCGRTLVTISLALDLKLWWLFPSSTDEANDLRKFSLRCYHSLSLGFHSYQQSLPFGTSTFYTGPWSNFVFKNDLVLAANLKLVAALFVTAPPYQHQPEQGGSRVADTQISYRQCRAASKLPYYCENDSINALTFKHNLLGVATSSGWILVYYINHPNQLLSEWEKGQPIWCRKLSPTNLLSESNRHAVSSITGIEISLDTCKPRVSVTTTLGLVVYTFNSNL